MGLPFTIHHKTLPKENMSPLQSTLSTLPNSYSGAINILAPTATSSGVMRLSLFFIKPLPKSAKNKSISSEHLINKILSGLISLWYIGLSRSDNIFNVLTIGNSREGLFY